MGKLGGAIDVRREAFLKSGISELLLPLSLKVFLEFSAKLQTDFLRSVTNLLFLFDKVEALCNSLKLGVLGVAGLESEFPSFS